MTPALFTQNVHRVFGWKNILREWNATLNMPPQVERLMANLKEACNPDSAFDPPISQFLTYLNYEEEGVAWLVYEALTLRWMWGDVRLDYLRELAEVVDLDMTFPSFPGSPLDKQTVRDFLMNSLTADELGVVQVMPALYYTGYSTPCAKKCAANCCTPPPIVRSQSLRASGLGEPVSAFSVPAPQPVAPVAPVAPVVKPSSNTALTITFFLQRKESSKDDVVYISKGEGSYTLTYHDFESNSKLVTRDMTHEDVLNHLSNLFRLLAVDEKPFEFLQVTLPCLPSILVSPENLTSQTRDLIYDSVEMTMQNWPARA